MALRRGLGALVPAGHLAPHAWAVDGEDRVVETTWAEFGHAYFGTAVQAHDPAEVWSDSPPGARTRPPNSVVGVWRFIGGERHFYVHRMLAGLERDPQVDAVEQRRELEQLLPPSSSGASDLSQRSSRQ